MLPRPLSDRTSRGLPIASSCELVCFALAATACSPGKINAALLTPRAAPRPAPTAPRARRRSVCAATHDAAASRRQSRTESARSPSAASSAASAPTTSPCSSAASQAPPPPRAGCPAARGPRAGAAPRRAPERRARDGPGVLRLQRGGARRRPHALDPPRAQRRDVRCRHTGAPRRALARPHRQQRSSPTAAPTAREPTAAPRATTACSDRIWRRCRRYRVGRAVRRRDADLELPQ